MELGSLCPCREQVLARLAGLAWMVGTVGLVEGGGCCNGWDA